MKNLELKILSPDDIGKAPAILSAASVSHNSVSTNSAEWFEWKYWGSPFGPAIIALAESHDGRIAGMVAFGQYQLTADDSNIKAALSYETFVHPDFRRGGLFTQLLELGVNTCKANGIEMMFNFPNTQSLPGFQKRGWVEERCVGSFLRFTNWVKSVKKFDLSFRSAPFVPDQIREFDPRDYEFFEECLSTVCSYRSATQWSAVRTSEYLLWRYRTYPLNRYIVIRDDSGWAIIRTGRRGSFSEAQIMEVFPSSSYSASFLRAICKRIEEKLAVDIITLSISKSHPLFRTTLAARFLPVPNHINFTYLPLDEHEELHRRSWVLTATEFHTY